MKEKEKDPSKADPNPAAPVSDEVMSILTDVEGQLDNLRAAQHTQDKAISLLKQRSEALRKARDEFEKSKQEYASQIKDSDSEIATLRERASDLEKLSAKERKELTEALASAKKELASAQDTAKQRTAEQKSDKGKHAETTKKLDAANKKVAELTRLVNEQGPQLERGAVALEMVKQQQEQIDRLTKQLAEHKLRSDPYEMQRREERIAELTEALRQARGQSADEKGIGELEQRNADLVQEVNRLKLKLEQAQVTAEQAKHQLKDQVDQQAAFAGREALIAEHALKVAELTAQIDQLRANGAADPDNSSWESEQAMKAHEKTIATLKERIAELEQERSSNGPASANGQEVDEHTAASLREKAQRVAAVAEHLRIRRHRLSRLRRLMKENVATRHAAPQPTERQANEELLRIEQERMQLNTVRRTLATSEKKMHRRWARHRAVVLVGSGVVVVLCCALASWALASHFFPATRSASVTLTARGKIAKDITPEQNEAWRAWHVNLLNDRGFQQNLAKRMHERALVDFADPERVAQKIREGLTIDGHHHATLILTLAGKDTSELTAFLDIVAATMMTESNRTMADRGDPLYAAADRQPDGATRYASLNDVPIKDDRMTYAMPIFGVLLAISLAAWVYLLARLLRAKRVFDEDNAGLFNDAQLTPTL